LKSTPNSVPARAVNGAVVSVTSAARRDVDGVDAAGAADPVEQAVGRTHVDADQVLARLQAGDRRRGPGRAGGVAVDGHQAVAGGQENQVAGAHGRRRGSRGRSRCRMVVVVAAAGGQGSGQGSGQQDAGGEMSVHVLVLSSCESMA